MAWIESHQSLSKHRKTIRAASLLRVDRFKLIGHLHQLWWWALDNVPIDGFLGDLTDEEIAMGAEWDGDPVAFVDALTKAGFIDVTEHGRYLHDWYDYAGKLMERRQADAERKRASRRSGNPQDVQRTSGGRPEDVHRKSEGHPEDIHRMSDVTQPNLTNEDEEEEDPAAQSGETAATSEQTECACPADENALHWRDYFRQRFFGLEPRWDKAEVLDNAAQAGVSHAVIIREIQRAIDARKRDPVSWAAGVIGRMAAAGVRTLADADRYEQEQREEEARRAQAKRQAKQQEEESKPRPKRPPLLEVPDDFPGGYQEA